MKWNWDTSNLTELRPSKCHQLEMLWKFCSQFRHFLTLVGWTTLSSNISSSPNNSKTFEARKLEMSRIVHVLEYSKNLIVGSRLFFVPGTRSGSTGTDLSGAIDWKVGGMSFQWRSLSSLDLQASSGTSCSSIHTYTHTRREEKSFTKDRKMLRVKDRRERKNKRVHREAHQQQR